MSRGLRLGMSMAVVDLFCSALGAAIAWYLVLISQATTDDGVSGKTAMLEFEVLDLPQAGRQPAVTDRAGISVACEFDSARRIVRPENSPQSGPDMPFTTITPGRGGQSRYTVILSGPVEKTDFVRVYLQDWHQVEEHSVRVRVYLQGPRASSPSPLVTLTREQPCWEMSLDGLTDPGATSEFKPQWRPYDGTR